MNMPADQASTNEIFVGRQAIFDEKLEIFAYELLFRDGQVNAASVVDGNHATSQVIINAFLEMGVEQIVQQHCAFINLTREFLLGEIPFPLPPGKIVLEVLEDVVVDDALVESVKRLKEEGFKIALDDFILDDKNHVLIPFADIIKIDLMAMTQQELAQQVMALEKYDVELLAEKIETKQEFELCKQLGFKYFQGYYFCKPDIVSGKQLPPNKLALLEMIATLQDPECRFDELESIISKDVAMSYKLLRIINSSFYGLSQKVESIQKALVVLGLQSLRNWMTVIGLSQIENKPQELITISLTRAKMCELLAPELGCDKNSSFTIGLFSMLDVLMDQPLNELLTQLPLAEEVTEALLEYNGALGNLLKIVVAYEKGDWKELEKIATCSPSSLRTSFLDSLAWSDEITSQMK
ncbi:MAG: HDOD domain-containing protein [Sulfuriflexus sp.]|nr:HDOD domain-containing protein [Sulfuriflexus sp.]